jgi:hypothetical protein
MSCGRNRIGIDLEAQSHSPNDIHNLFLAIYPDPRVREQLIRHVSILHR